MHSQEPNLRILEEKISHFYKIQDYFSLKNSISSIESFLLLFNPLTKYDLCRYWQTLEHEGYDPVVEYSSAIQFFDMHHCP